MKWHEVMRVVIDAALADTGLAAIYGTNMRVAGEGTIVGTVLEYALIADGETELEAPCTIQFDQWCLTMSELARSEQRLRRLFHRELPTPFDGLGMWAQYQDGASLASPNRDGYFARAIRFRFTPLRDRYEPAPTP